MALDLQYKIGTKGKKETVSPSATKESATRGIEFIFYIIHRH